ncbi:hypothetical protein GCM10027037_04410 [Mucilaginibacter koreensis]
MPVQIIKYREWTFEVDPETTSLLYQNVAASGTEECACGNCKYFLSIKSDVYPLEIKDLFVKLGIDITKEYEVCDLGDQATTYVYSGWFHFVGRILDGNDDTIQENAGRFNYKKVNGVFDIGFTTKISASFFDNNEYPLVQVEFLTTVPYPLN